MSLSISQKQHMLNTFIQKVNGKGQAKRKSSSGIFYCAYVLDGHPGCAIGCQNKFVETCKKKGVDLCQDISISHSCFDKIIEELYGNDGDTRSFLVYLQTLHDTTINWAGKTIKRFCIEDFCNLFNLQIPKSEYA